MTGTRTSLRVVGQEVELAPGKLRFRLTVADQAYPLDVHIYPDSLMRPTMDAHRHPSGCWVAVRLADTH